MSPTNAELAQQLKEYQQEQKEQGKLLERLTVLIELLVPRVKTLEDAAKERSEKWKGAAIGFLSSLLVALIVLGLSLLLAHVH